MKASIHVGLKSSGVVAVVIITVVGLILNVRMTRELTPHGSQQVKAKPNAAAAFLNEIENGSGGDDDDDDDTMLSVPTLPKRLCSRDEIRKGFWEKHVYQEGLAYDPNQVPQLHANTRCHFDVDTNGAWHTWRWVPFNSTDAVVGNQGCEMTRWNKNEFCSVMRDHYTTSSTKTNTTTTTTAIPTILITGDSLSSEHYISVLGLLGMPKGDHPASFKAMHAGIQALACNGTVQLAENRRNQLEKLGKDLTNRKPTVVVFNRGAHYVNDTILEQGLRRNIVDLKKWQKGWCVQTSTPCRLFFRTTTPGHRNCSQFNNEPVNDVAYMEEFVAQSDIYNWSKYKHQNELMLSWFDKAGLDYQVIDGYDLLLLRPDSHMEPDRDCSHNCLPGKPDVYNELLLHYLKLSVAGAKSR
jgi:hypothetical protein